MEIYPETFALAIPSEPGPEHVGSRQIAFVRQGLDHLLQANDVGAESPSALLTQNVQSSRSATGPGGMVTTAQPAARAPGFALSSSVSGAGGSANEAVGLAAFPAVGASWLADGLHQAIVKAAYSSMIFFAQISSWRSQLSSPPAHSFVPLENTLLGDIFAVDSGAVQRDLRGFLEDVGQVRHWVTATPSGSAAGWFLAGFVASAISLEVIRRRRRTPTVEQAGAWDEDSVWALPSTISDFNRGPRP
jgi:hypothetical protein